MNKLAIIGAGTMGHSIALSAAWHGQTAEVFGVDAHDVERAQKGFESKLQLMAVNELIGKKEVQEIKSRVTFHTSMEETVKGADFIIEAVPENMELKHKVYRQLENLIRADIVIASNSSGLMPTALAEQMDHPERFVLTHFWNPAHLIPLVEIVAGERTSEKTLRQTRKVIEQMNKKPVLLKKELPGFIGNRLQFALFREAQALLDAGVASKEDIDAAVTYSIGRRLPVTGPLQTADLGGLDIFYAISDYLFEDLSTDQKPGRTLRELVEENHLGEKSGRGFYDWPAEKSKAVQDKREEALIHFLKQDMEAE
ncbi:3-hydroxyacyl-CoA dehydrogenase NAD-binding domain-containing protein [Planococcus sp. ISL-109]|uniref:3-hydroxyacyl-CoA dehydrogenase family protein n=1 Tax=Planococcus sp. ISL-109 TaxID=2819166 RepID=UPI001BECE1C6|nr:3-hydroxyacyl-CoA dehydrogenase NAD-binding domain-containing protein [Planococcus sp. ISL-109]MBT2581594.1 NAD(P)-binding domain-containing protein [Planococcus sp. ISL-109]